MQNSVVIASACRTPIGDLLGALKDVHAQELARIAGAEALRRANIFSSQVDEVVCGNVIQAGVGANIGRQVQGALGNSLAGSGLHREPAMCLIHAGI